MSRREKHLPKHWYYRWSPKIIATLGLQALMLISGHSTVFAQITRVTSSDQPFFSGLIDFDGAVASTRNQDGSGVVVAYAGRTTDGVAFEWAGVSFQGSVSAVGTLPIYSATVPGTNDPFAYVAEPTFSVDGAITGFGDNNSFPTPSGGVYDFFWDGQEMKALPRFEFTADTMQFPIVDRIRAHRGAWHSSPGQPAEGQSSITFMELDAALNQRILRNVEGNTTVIADATTSIPGASGTFGFFDDLSQWGSHVVFNTPNLSSTQPAGVYGDIGSGLIKIADTSDPIPGGSENFHSFAYPSVSGTNFVFMGTDSVFESGVYADFGSGLVALADASTPDPDGTGTLSNFVFPVVSESHFAFVSDDGDSQLTLYRGMHGVTSRDGNLTRIVGAGDTIDGKTVNFITLGREGLIGGNLAFHLAFTDGSEGVYVSLEANPLSGDFDADGQHTFEDLDLMFAVGPIAGGVAAIQGVTDQFDLDGDGQINLTDRDIWLSNAGTANGFASPIKLGDANVDGIVNGADFVRWNTNKFSGSLLWSEGNFNGDTAVNGRDFLEWNRNKFTNSDALGSAPEPAHLGVVGLAVLILACRSCLREP